MQKIIKTAKTSAATTNGLCNSFCKTIEKIITAIGKAKNIYYMISNESAAVRRTMLKQMLLGGSLI